MKLTTPIVMAAVIAAGAALQICSGPLAHAEEVSPLQSRKDIVSYSIGVETARNLQKGSIDIDLDQVIRGMKDAQGNRVQLPESVVRKAMKDVQSELHRNLAMARKLQSKQAQDARGAQPATGKEKVAASDHPQKQ
ncbi:FKBP-type peptidyl-prolyl cis-trans isomerase N-terminal domain-containing protein [Geomonas sp. Red32]|uniref:FKBP-type peptidyl-prolyl cis-trans isomerase N-terminal domain-containing protein n=1 Tax=Geomonas sp. Red32 TaxID=2912856 RepID=UPI00202CB3CE|nr:FKBP-type peptidyl-prolyl cis-trans isomerase N-terminal domain-containing protein [Geomonas sp. Red32]MCM0083590.1 FKBP-type peptidyl-prolyl cis-trans isomerase N-terminal domain-containing protein [Geomonas sp. Red32]